MQLFGKGSCWLRYHSAAISWSLNNLATRRIAVSLRCAACTPYLALRVMYATTSPITSRGANFPARQRQLIAGCGCSRSGSRRIEPSMNGGRLSVSLAAIPAGDATSGTYEFK